MASERDRDSQDRARNARPRDGLGRPLPRGEAGVPTIADDLHLTAGQTVALAQELLDRGSPFHAHEVLEARWKAVASDPERALWQGLAQLAVGLTHAARGNEVGARRLIARGQANLRAAVDPARSVDVIGVIAWADRWLAGERTNLRLAGTAPPGS